MTRVLLFVLLVVLGCRPLPGPVPPDGSGGAPSDDAGAGGSGGEVPDAGSPFERCFLEKAADPMVTKIASDAEMSPANLARAMCSEWAIVRRYQ